MTSPQHPASARKPRWARGDFVRFIPVPTRWDDNDPFGHVNNVKYYAFFDTAITRIEIAAGIFNTVDSPVVPYVVESSCTYFESVAFPDDLEVGVAIERIGNTSATYRLGLFRLGEAAAAAQGRFVHVYVERATERPIPLPQQVRTFAQGLMVEGSRG